MLLDQYADHIVQAIRSIQESQRQTISRAAELVCSTLRQDGLIYVFGCGHSHILAEETFYRAGGLVNVAPIFYEPLMLHEGAAESSRLEKQPGLAQKVLEGYRFTNKDLLFCVSTSGINAVPVEVAQAVRGLGVPVIAICSGAYTQDPSRAPGGKHLWEVADLWLDNLAPHGDATLQPKGSPVPTTPLSTITGAFLLNGILAEGMELALAAGAEVPAYLSGNIPGGAERNQALIRQFQPRIRHL